MEAVRRALVSVDAVCVVAVLFCRDLDESAEIMVTAA